MGSPSPPIRPPGPGTSPTAPVGRLAPSPTGELHVGHARSFLLAWWSARARAGRVVLRIEDLDGTRCKPEYIDACLRDLEWLGLDWDGEPFLQSRHTASLEAAVERLVATGMAYGCTCSRREILQALSAPHAGGELRYPGTCRGRYPSPARAQRTSGKPVGLRFRVPLGPRALEDQVAGRFIADVHAEVGDFLLARRDGAFAYQLACVVHDAEQGVDEVLRGDDLLASTVRQWMLQEALGLPHPVWWHVPLVVTPEGRRLSKRDGDRSLAELREAGVDPRRIVRWAATSVGLEVTDPLTPTEVLGGPWPVELGGAPLPYRDEDLDGPLSAPGRIPGPSRLDSR